MKKKFITVIGLLAACLMMATAAWAGDNGTLKIGGQIWLKKADCGGAMTWSAAGSAASTLASGTCGLNDGSKAGDWRVPSITELTSLAGNTAGFGALKSDYWSSTESVMSRLKGAAIWNPASPSVITTYAGKSSTHYVLFIHK